MTRFTTAQNLGALILAASAITVPAAAQPGEPPVSISVSYADLDIGHPAGAMVLLHRLRTASVQACGGAPDVRLLAEVAAFDRCRREAVGGAIAQVNSPELNAAAVGRGGAEEFAKQGQAAAAPNFDAVPL